MNEKTLNQLAAEAHEIAKSHGFWDGYPSMEHNMMMVVTEISEAIEADRKESADDKTRDYAKIFEDLHKKGMTRYAAFNMSIKGTKNEELADIAIRLLNIAGRRGVDFTKLTPCRYYRAFDNFSFAENAFGLVKGLTRDNHSVERRIQFGLHYLQEWCKQLGVHLEWYVRAKLAYNKNREYLHNKKY